jgi:hypothetical protein
VLGERDASLQHRLEQRYRAQHAACHPEGESRGGSLHHADIAGGQFVICRDIDQDQPGHALRTSRGQPKRHVTAQIHPDDGRACHAQGCHRGIQILRLGRNSEIRVRGAV